MTQQQKVIQFAGIERGKIAEIEPFANDFLASFSPLEDTIHLLGDTCTGACYCECHMKASRFVELSTVDVPLDPEEQPEYRANRAIVDDHSAFEQMKADALKGRSFSNLVAEYTKAYDPSHPLKIIGGQHRHAAIVTALGAGIDEYHGVKVYFGLDTDQRLDVQLISNTNISVANDLLDRMYETKSGPQLRTWCQSIGLLNLGQDFADKRGYGQPFSVRSARTFILNFIKGVEVGKLPFDATDTTPVLAETGFDAEEWDGLRQRHKDLWSRPDLKIAGEKFSKLIAAQRAYFQRVKPRRIRLNIDYGEKALNYAVISAWAYTSGLLQGNPTRLQRHYELSNTVGKDPLNAEVLAKARHKTDSDNYRGLGYRTDAKERGRLVELFYAHAEKGGGITKRLVEIAMAKYHAKQAQLEVEQVKAKQGDE